MHVSPRTLAGDTLNLFAEYWRSGTLGRVPLPDPKEMAEQQLATLVDHLADEFKLAIGRHGGEGRPAERIAERAAETAADLLVVGAHGARPLRDLFMGSTAQKLASSSPCPLLLVKQTPSYEYERIVLPTDFSAPARSAAALARAFFPASRCYLLNVYELPFEGTLRYAGVDDTVLERYHHDAQRLLQEQLKAFSQAVGFPGGEVSNCVQHGHPSWRIVDFAQEVQADLIVIAAHGASELERLMLGSVSLQVVTEGRCDVLLVRPA